MSTGGKLGQFVVAEANAEADAYYDPSTGYVVIGRDVLEREDGVKKSVSRAWFAAALHETTHGTKGTVGQMLMTGAMEDLDGGKYYTQMLKDLSNRGYLEGKASDIRTRIERAVEKDAKGQQLSKKEAADMAVFLDEAPSIMAEHVLNNEHFLRRLLAADAGLVEKLLGKIAETKEALARAGDADAKALHSEIVKIEDIFMDSVAEAGMKYRKGKLVMVNRDDEEDDTAGAVKESRKATEEELANRKFTYSELVAKGDLQGVVIDKSRQVPKLPDGSIDVKAMQNIVKSQCQTVRLSEKDTRYYVEIPDIGRRVQITNDGIKHGFAAKKERTSSPFQFDNARATLELPFILKNSIEVNRLESRGNPDILFSRVLVGTVGMEDANGKVKYYAVRSVIEERVNQIPVWAEMDILGNLYALNAKKVGPNNPRVVANATLPSGSSAAYSYSVAHFLDDVKRVFKNTFSNNVYQALGMQRKQDDFSEDLKFSRKPKAKKPANEHAFDDAVARMEERDASSDGKAAEGGISSAEKAADDDAVTRTNEEKVQVSEDKQEKTVLHPSFTYEQIQDNMISLAKMDAVEKIDASKLERTGKRPKDIFMEFFDRIGNRIESPVFGSISLSNSSAKSEIRHGLTAEKIASIEAIPSVVQNGKVIFHERKGDSDVERIVVCAPIQIAEDDYYMGVMLQRDSQNQRLYLHSVVAVESSEKEMTTSSQANRVTNGALEDNDHLFTTSILQRAVDVKLSARKSQKKNVGAAERGVNEYKLPEDPRALELRGDQRKALANWSRNKVYSRKDAMEIVDGVVQLIGKIASGNSEDGKNFHVAKVLGRVRERSIDQLFAELNTAGTPTEREAVAQKIAEQMIAEARVSFFTAKFGLTLAKAGRICYNIGTEFFTEWISPKGNERYV